MKRRTLREAWTLETVAEAQIVHDALGMVRDALGDDLSPAAKVDLDRVLREIAIFNKPRTKSDPGERWAALRSGGSFSFEIGWEVVIQLEIAFDLMAQWTAEEIAEDGEPALSAEQQDALVGLQAQIGGSR